MNKKGVTEEQLDWIKDLVFAVLIIIFFLAPQFKIKDNTFHNLNVEIRDYASTKDVASLSPGKLVYIYQSNPNITLSTTNNCIIHGETTAGVKLDYECSVKNSKVQEITSENQIELVKS